MYCVSLSKLIPFFFLFTQSYQLEFLQIRTVIFKIKVGFYNFKIRNSNFSVELFQIKVIFSRLILYCRRFKFENQTINLKIGISGYIFSKMAVHVIRFHNQRISTVLYNVPFLFQMTEHCTFHFIFFNFLIHQLTFNSVCMQYNYT